jgi:hypothetical protein
MEVIAMLEPSPVANGSLRDFPRTTGMARRRETSLLREFSSGLAGRT